MEKQDFEALLLGLPLEPSPADMDTFFQKIRFCDETYYACQPQSVRTRHRQGLQVVSRLGQTNVPIALGLAMHLYMTGAIASFPLRDESPLNIFRWGLLNQLKDQRMLMANTASNRNLGGSVEDNPTPSYKEGNRYIINGRRTFMSMADRADMLALVVELEGEHHFFLVPVRNNPAIRFGASPVTATMDLSETYTVHLDGLEVQAVQEFGMDGTIKKQDLLAFQRIWFQSLVPAVYLGGARRALNELARASRTKTTSEGRLLCESEAFLAQLGQLRIRIDAAYALLESCGEAIHAFSCGELALQTAYDRSVVAKTEASRCAREVVGEICCLMGSASMRPGSLVERIQREVAFGEFHPMNRLDAQKRMALRCLEEVT